MKQRIISIVCGLGLSVLAMQAERVMVISDPHVIAQSLLQPGTAADEMLAAGRKMLDLSEPAWKALMDTALLYQPDLLLIPGDLTKDGEAISHDTVVASLARLQAAGIPTLVIPGNHDISNPAAYAYNGDQKIAVPTITDAQFDQLYAPYMGAVREPNSHCYVAEPLDGVTVLAIDGTHGDAGTGSLSDATLNWLLSQADAAQAKGNLIIAMCHWQILEHVDNMAELMSSSLLDTASYVAQQLAAHQVRFILTGHFHVNGATTKYFGNDSIVEVTTGAPVAYPCPYRWLDISADRSTVTVGTEEIRSLDTIADLHSYSRTWQEAHTWTMLPQMSRKAWTKVDKYVNVMKNSTNLSTRMKGIAIAALLPTDDAERYDYFERNMGQAVVNLFMLHSDANEPDRPEKDSVKDAMYDGLSNMIVDVIGVESQSMRELVALMSGAAVDMMTVPVESMCEDLTEYTSNTPNRTDDLSLVLTLQAPRQQGTGIERPVEEWLNPQWYDIMGRQVREPVPGQVVIRKNHKQVNQ